MLSARVFPNQESATGEHGQDFDVVAALQLRCVEILEHDVTVDREVKDRAPQLVTETRHGSIERVDQRSHVFNRLDALIGLGISHERMSTVSYGEELPLCKDNNEACWAENRRGHLVELRR